MSNLGYLCSFSWSMYTVKYRVIMEKYFSRMYSKFIVMRLCSHLIVTLIKKKKQRAWFGKAYFEKYLSTPPVMTWVSRKMFNNSE